MTEPSFRVLACGDTALTVEFGEAIDPALNAAVLALEARILAARPAGLVETVPTYRSLTLHIDPLETNPAAVEEAVRELARGALPVPARRRLWRVPVVYGGEHGIDLDGVAEHHGMPAREVVERHAAPEYRVVMLGFLPGYAYLAGLDPRLALSRRPNPRPVTPAGSISIGGAQALVASIAAPSGWHLLGRTPVRSFAPGREPVFLFEPGDAIRFMPTDPCRWDALDRAAAAGEWVAERVERDA
ncbi:KipI family sensor histidine kinase inhibitor [Methylobacterium sp. BE186]|uniref:5-oxoprolinase subunit PxpB n=1 Tax=Methylobacterium sp. BE186 TaxID=2817715 RepID=UPI0028585E3D|nr:5-oxoprolinase subunit PxpB [Methylobacterium sp. BE186]MDR7037085.1 KipI family sensor histidine kinase inhibitor [Methylobacterium sp. BE186]